MKHNKKRNTAFLYECLIRELTITIVRSDEVAKQKVINIVKENFSKGMILYEDLQLYKQLLETKTTKREASRFLFEVRRDWDEYFQVKLLLLALFSLPAVRKCVLSLPMS